MRRKITFMFILFLFNTFLIFAIGEDYSALVKFNLYHYNIDQQHSNIDNYKNGEEKYMEIGYLAEPYDSEIMWEIKPVLTDSLELVRLDDDNLTYEYDNTIPYVLGFQNSWDDTNPLLFDSNNQIVVTPNNSSNNRRVLCIKVTNPYKKQFYDAGRYFTMFYIKAYFVDDDGNKTTEEPVAQNLLEYAVEIKRGNSSSQNAESSDNTAYIHITPEQLASSIDLTSLYSSLNNFLKVGTIEYIQTRSGSYGDDDALDVDLIISPVPDVQSLDGSTFAFVKTDSSYQIPYKVAVAENGTYHDHTFILEDVGDLINWQTSSRDSQSGNFKNALIPLFIKGEDSIILNNQILEAGNYTSTIYVNVINPD